MAVHVGLAGKLVHYAVAGTVGNLIVRGAQRAAPAVAPTARRLAISGVAQGILLTRKLEEAAEEARLRVGDVVAEARGQLGEEAPPPTPPTTRPVDAPGHQH
jgi:hypothetical protein